jgi:hypothetical protein
MLTYADVCCRMLTYAAPVVDKRESVTEEMQIE